jgi:hypothetical protein
VVEDLAGAWLAYPIRRLASLTELGAAHHLTLIGKIGAVRRARTRDVTAEQYATLIDLLERMAANLAVSADGTAQMTG